MQKWIAVLIVSLLSGCGTAQKLAPVLSQADAIGRGAAQVLGWCEENGANETTLELARKALEDRDYNSALLLAEQMVGVLRDNGQPIPEQTEVMLRLAQGALAAQAIQDGMRALSGPRD